MRIRKNWNCSLGNAIGGQLLGEHRTRAFREKFIRHCPCQPQDGDTEARSFHSCQSESFTSGCEKKQPAASIHRVAICVAQPTAELNSLDTFPGHSVAQTGFIITRANDHQFGTGNRRSDGSPSIEHLIMSLVAFSSYDAPDDESYWL